MFLIGLLDYLMVNVCKMQIEIFNFLPSREKLVAHPA